MSEANPSKAPVDDAGGMEATVLPGPLSSCNSDWLPLGGHGFTQRCNGHWEPCIQTTCFGNGHYHQMQPQCNSISTLAQLLHMNSLTTILDM